MTGGDQGVGDGAIQAFGHEPAVVAGGSGSAVGAGDVRARLHHLVDLLDLSAFDAHYRNDEVGASAHAPAMLLKAVLLAYSQDIVSSRAIERACRDNVLFIALTGDAKLRLLAAEHHRTSFNPDHASAMPATAH